MKTTVYVLSRCLRVLGVIVPLSLMGQYPQLRVPDYAWSGMKAKIEMDTAAEIFRSMQDVKQVVATGFSVSYPANWDAFGSDDTVTLIPPGGLVRQASGEPYMTFGMHLTYLKPALQQMTVKQYTDAWLTTGKTHPGFQLEKLQQKVSCSSVMGVSGGTVPLLLRRLFTSCLETDFSLKSIKGVREMNRILTIEDKDGIRMMLWTAPASQFEASVPLFKKISESISLKSAQ